MTDGPIFKGLRRNLRRQFPGEKIEIWRERPGKPAKFSVGTREGGGITGSAVRGALRIKSSGVPDAMQGKGRGSKLYAGLARAARGSNRALESDGEVSPQAQRRYKGLARSGNKVFYGGRRAYTDTGNRRPDGKSFTRDGSPAFVVNPATKPKGYRRVFKASEVSALDVLSAAIEKAGVIMADKLVETDEEVEKARRLISPRARRQGAMMDRKFSGGKLTNPSSALDRRISRRKPGHFLRNGRMLLKKSSDAPTALEALDSAIEKARGLLPGGKGKINTFRQNAGTSRAAGRLQSALKRHNSKGGSLNRRGRGAPQRRKMFGSRLEGALRYLNTRARRNAQTRGLGGDDR